jgi:hypothetical protein
MEMLRLLLDKMQDWYSIGEFNSSSGPWDSTLKLVSGMQNSEMLCLLLDKVLDVYSIGELKTSMGPWTLTMKLQQL